MRKSMITTGLVAIFPVSGLALASPAMAEERTCRGTIGAVTVDNVRVLQGATCRLSGTIVQGTIKIERNARLFAMDIPVVGEVQAEDHDRVEVRSSRVGGSIQLDQGESAVLRNNRVGQDVQSFSNTGSQISTLNRIDGNLQCKQNNPRPMGGQNTVGGSKQDRCANL